MTYQIVSERKLRYPVRISDPKDVYQAVRRYARAKKEQFIVLTLNGHHEIISICIVSIGLVNKTIVHPREVFNRAIRDMASAIIVCHNHPSGKTEPSPEDLDVTVRIREAGNIIGIQLLDHLIISKSGFTSLKQRGILD